MECNSEICRRHSFLHQNPKLTEVFSPRASRSSKPRDKDKASQRHTVAQDTGDGRPLFPPRFPGNYQKLWPSRASVDAEELVKHMSNVPVYLQRAERGGNVQEKALNFGVLDWRRLEKWTDNHRRATVNGDASASPPASSNASSSFSPFGSSSQSCRSSASTYPYQMNLSPSVNHHRDSCAEHDHSHLSREQTPRLSHDTGSHLPELTSRECPVRRRISFSKERCQRMNSLATRCEGNNKQDGPEDVSDSLGPSPAARILPSGSQNCEISNSVSEKMKPHQFRSDFRKTSRDLGLVCHGLPPCFSDDCPQDRHSSPFQLDGCPLDHFQESSQGDRRFSCASTVNCTIPTEPGRASFVGTFPSEDFSSVHLSPDVPHSCPLPSNIHANGWSDMHASGSELWERSFPLHSIKSPRNSNEVALLKLDSCHGKHDKCAVKLQKSFAAETPGRWHRNVKKAFTGGRDTLPSRQSNASPTRSSSLRGSSDIKHGTRAYPGSQNPEEETDITKSRRSPLRRLLDPLLKTKASNVSHVATQTAGSPRLSTHEKKLLTDENLTSNQRPQSLFNMTNRSSGGDTVKGSTPSSYYIPMEIEDSLYDEKHEASSTQAVLQLTWKNGLPLFTFSVNEIDILAATRKRDTSSKEGYECIYTFYYIRENKKKTGGRIKQGNKGRRKELASNIVGLMNVSCLNCPKNHFSVMEFILFGPELRPTDGGTLDPVPNSELAAIVLRVPGENTESFLDTLPHDHTSSCVLRPNLETKKHACLPGGNSRSGQSLGKNSPKMVAILPSEVHGLSDTGKPATLVERWKSGGLCDCGGWDVGCSLTILTNNLQDSSIMPGSVQSHNDAIHGRNRVELFIQGGGQERKPLFSLVDFREGLYMVDFHASIEVLQAFSVCIAILHGRKPRGPYELQGSRLCKSTEGFLVKNLAGKQADSSMSVPYHPPLSPVGRA